MIINFKTKKVREICTIRKKAVRELGDRTAKQLLLRMTQISAFDNLEDIPITKPFRRHKLNGDRNGFFAVNIDSQYRIILEPMDGELNDLSSISVICIEEVSKHYE